MNRSIIVAIVLIIIVVIGIIVYLSIPNGASAPTTNINTTIPNSSATNTPSQSAVTVDISNFAFNPSTVTVSAGTQITWVNNDSVQHTVTSDSGTVLNSPMLSKGQSYTVTINQAGTYAYYCIPHPNMRGTVVVQ